MLKSSTVYEAEANAQVESANQIPAAILARFHELTGKVTAKTLLPWSEHCTECVAPTCYSTCDLYTPRADLKCRRFTDGMVRIDDARAVNGYVLKLRFKRWAQLWAQGNTYLYDTATAKAAEKKDRFVGSLIFKAPLPHALRRGLMRRRYDSKRRQATMRARSDERPNCFVAEIYNPQDRPISLTFSIIPADPNNKIQFNHLITLQPGFTRERFSADEIERVIDMRSRYHMSIVANDIDDGTTLYFGLLDFVHDASFVPDPKEVKVKCVVWDLDNTLWQGTLIEDGADRLEVKPEVIAVIQELDRRGILQSVASKNNRDEVLAVLERTGLREYFLHPQISWGPKSAAIEQIVRAFNIGLDTVLFVDDSEFERSQVHSALPSVRVVSASECASLPDRQDCTVSVTAESRARRKMYQDAMIREAAAGEFDGDYMSFLKDCHIVLEISPLTETNLERVHELTQRTNQMNFSGNLYSRDVLQDIMHSSLRAYVINCKDRFGSYGTMGFCIVEPLEPRVRDLMFSCRIQSKRIEHAFLTYLLKDMMRASPRDCYFTYKRTPRNAAAGKVFDDFGMELVEDRDGVATLVFRAGRPIPDDNVVEIVQPVVFNPLAALSIAER